MAQHSPMHGNSGTATPAGWCDNRTPYSDNDARAKTSGPVPPEFFRLRRADQSGQQFPVVRPTQVSPVRDRPQRNPADIAMQPDYLSVDCKLWQAQSPDLLRDHGYAPPQVSRSTGLPCRSPGNLRPAWASVSHEDDRAPVRYRSLRRRSGVGIKVSISCCMV